MEATQDAARGQASAPARTWAIALLVAVSAIPLLLPGDAPFINDEPQLIANAWNANVQHQLATTGLEGNLGVRYGPLPTWIYQGLLLVSHNFIVLVVLRAALATAVTALALWWFSRTLGLWPWFASIVLLSPYLWFYSRLLWDNTFCIPLSALGFAAYAAFLERRWPTALYIAFASIWALSLVHLMSLAFSVPLALHMLVFERKALRQHKWALLVVALFMGALGASYAWHLFHSSLQSAKPAGAAGWGFALLGPRMLSASGLGYFFGPGWHLGSGLEAGGIAQVAILLAYLSFPMVWIGIGLAVYSLVHHLRNKERFGAREHALLLSLAILVAQILLNGITGTAGHPHYYNATWITSVVFAWFALEYGAILGRVLAIPYAAGLATTLMLLISGIHKSAGWRVGYGPTLQNQMQVAGQLNEYTSDSPIRFEVANYQRFPHTLSVVRLLEPATQEPKRRGMLRIVYSSPDPQDGRITLVRD